MGAGSTGAGAGVDTGTVEAAEVVGRWTGVSARDALTGAVACGGVADLGCRKRNRTAQRTTNYICIQLTYG